MKNTFEDKYGELMDKCHTANGSNRPCFSLAMLSDDDVEYIVKECPDWSYLDVTDDGGNTLWEKAEELGLIKIHEDCIEELF